MLSTVKGYGKSVKLSSETATALINMLYQAAKDGISYPLLYPVSGYRTMREQEALWEGSDKSGVWVAHPGSSVHQTGRAVDLWLGFNLPGKGMSKEDRDKRLSDMRDSAAYKWLAQNANKFGFYPYSVEPWHWEYGKPHTSDKEAIAKEVAAMSGDGKGNSIATLAGIGLLALLITGR